MLDISTTALCLSPKTLAMYLWASRNVATSYRLPSVSTNVSAEGLMLALADVAADDVPAMAGGKNAAAELCNPTCLRIPEFEAEDP